MSRSDLKPPSSPIYRELTADEHIELESRADPKLGAELAALAKEAADYDKFEADRKKQDAAMAAEAKAAETSNPFLADRGDEP